MDDERRKAQDLGLLGHSHSQSRSLGSELVEDIGENATTQVYLLRIGSSMDLALTRDKRAAVRQQICRP